MKSPPQLSGGQRDKNVLLVFNIGDITKHTQGIWSFTMLPPQTRELKKITIALVQALTILRMQWRVVVGLLSVRWAPQQTRVFSVSLTTYTLIVKQATKPAWASGRTSGQGIPGTRAGEAGFRARSSSQQAIGERRGEPAIATFSRLREPSSSNELDLFRCDKTCHSVDTQYPFPKEKMKVVASSVSSESWRSHEL